jgi:hypothetical protein
MPAGFRYHTSARRTPPALVQRGPRAARTKPSPPYEQPRHTRPVSGSGARQVSERARGGYGAPADRRARLRAEVPARVRDRARGRRGDRAPRRRGRRRRRAQRGDRARCAGRLAARLDDHLEWPSRPLPRRRSRPLRHPLTIVGGAPEAAAALLLFAAIGVGNTLVDIGAYTLPARLAPDAVMARSSQPSKRSGRSAPRSARPSPRP